jgi:hypothetical protein
VAVAIYLLPFSRTFIALVKRLAGSPKGAEIDPNLPHANKSVTPRYSTLSIYMDGSLSSTKLGQAVAILPSIFPERSIALVKTTGWFTKGAEIDPNLPHANNKVLLKVAHAFYIH